MLVSVLRTQFDASAQGTHLCIPISTNVRSVQCMDEELYEEGYDLEGEVGPFMDTIHDEPGPKYHNEERPGEDTEKQAAEGSVQAPAPYTPLSEADIKKMKVTDLRDELHKRKKSVKGKKDELMQCLIDFKDLPADASAGGDQQIDQQPASFHHGAKWRVLEQDKTKQVNEPNEIPGLKGPTVPKGGKECEKFDFSDDFDHDPFIVMSKEYEWNSKGQVKVGKDGKPKMSERIHMQG